MFPSPVESNQRPAVRLFNDLNLPFFAWHAPLPATWIPHWKLPKSRYFSEKNLFKDHPCHSATLFSPPIGHGPAPQARDSWHPKKRPDKCWLYWLTKHDTGFIRLYIYFKKTMALRIPLHQAGTAMMLTIDQEAPESNPQDQLHLSSGRKLASQITEQLRATLQLARSSQINRQNISSGFAALDPMLPGGGYEEGSLVDLFGSGPADGRWWIAWHSVPHALRNGRYAVVVEKQPLFYPPAIASLRVPIESLVVVRCRDDRECEWAIDQSLRSPAVGVVIAEVDTRDDRMARRWQLSVEHGGGLGLLIRPPSAHPQRTPSWAQVQWQVTSCPRRTSQHRPDPSSRGRWSQLRLLRCPKGRGGAAATINLLDPTAQWPEKAA
jgi:hypothetical protein